jgi:sortase A
MVASWAWRGRTEAFGSGVFTAVHSDMLTSRSQRLWVFAETVAWTFVAVGLGVLITRYVDRALGARQAAVESAVQRPGSQSPDLAEVPTASQPDLTLWSPQRIAAWRTASTQPSAVPLAVLRIPRINLEVPVLEGTSEATLNTAVGHVEATALPGFDGNSGIAGHCDGFFQGLKNVASGDAIELETVQGIEQYRIQRTWIVAPDDVSVLDRTPNRSLTLMTCFPFDGAGSASQRYIVRAVRMGRPDLAQRTANVSGF